MRTVVMMIVIVSASCAAPNATRGEQVLAGLDRRAAGLSMMAAGAGLAASASAETLSAIVLNDSLPESVRDDQAATTALVVVPTALIAVGFLVAGTITYRSGRDLVVDAIDGTSETRAKESEERARARAEEADEMQERLRKQRDAKDCTPGWDCPVEER